MDQPLTQFKLWYLRQPLVTRTYLTGSCIIAAGLSLGFLSPYSLYYTFDTGILEFNIWRLVTFIMFQGKFSFFFLFRVYFAHMCLSNVQIKIFEKHTYADFLWLIIMLWGSLVLIASILPLYFAGDAFTFALIYIYCKKRPHEIYTLFFGFQVKSGYFPWVWMGLNVLMGDAFLPYLLGLVFGHGYITIKDIFTVRYHRDYLSTPRFFKNWIYGRNLDRQQRRANQQQARPFFAGRGVRLQ